MGVSLQKLPKGARHLLATFADKIDF